MDWFADAEVTAFAGFYFLRIRFLEGIVVCVGRRVLQGIAGAWLSVCGLGLTDVEDDRGADDVVHRVDAATETRSSTLVLSIRNHRVARLLALGSR